MSFEQVEQAIAAALAGVEPDSPVFEKTWRNVALDAQRDAVVAKKVGERQTTLNGLVTRVPIYRFSARGVKAVEVWPCLSFNLIGASFAAERYIHKADRFAKAVQTTVKTIELDNVEYTGPTLRKIRPNPPPYDVRVEIRSWSKDEHESNLLLDLILKTFEPRGALKVMQEDRETVLREMYQENIANLDAVEPMLADREKRAYSWAVTFVVETFLDNTLDTTHKRTITDPQLTMTPNVEEEE